MSHKDEAARLLDHALNKPSDTDGFFEVQAARTRRNGATANHHRRHERSNGGLRMTTIDHQQAAIDSVAEVACIVLGHDSQECHLDWEIAEVALTAATPHLRAAWEQEMARAVRRLPWKGITRGGMMVPLDAVLALLEGGGE